MTNPYKELLEKVETLKNIMVAYATGSPADETY